MISQAIQPGSVNRYKAMSKGCWLVFAVALLLRAGWGMWRMAHDQGDVSLEFPDEQQYWRMATSFAQGDGLRDEFGFRATRMPLYPGMLSIFTQMPSGILLAKVSHWLFGAGAAMLVAMLGRQLFSPAVGIVAGLLVAFDPFLIFFSSLLLTETLFILVSIALYLCMRPMMMCKPVDQGWSNWLVVGLMSAVCVYVRESCLGLVMLMWLWLVFCAKARTRAIGGAALAMLVVVVALWPWAARNSRVAGEWCWLTHRGGVSLYDGVGPQADGSSDLGDVQMMSEVRDLDETAWNRWFMTASWESMRHDPARIVKLAGVKLLRLWNPLPNVETYQSSAVRAISAIWTIPIYGFALVGAWRLSRIGGSGKWRITVWLLLPVIYISGVHCLFVGSVRYRLPAMPMLELLAAWAVVWLWERRLVHRTKSS